LTFKDLQKLVQSQSDPDQSHTIQRVKDKPFWIWDQSEHKQEDIKTKGNCCFNHIIGLPRKDGKIEKLMFDYEKLLYDSLLTAGLPLVISLATLKPASPWFVVIYVRKYALKW
jgi:hypothetical protein